MKARLCINISFGLLIAGNMIYSATGYSRSSSMNGIWLGGDLHLHSDHSNDAEDNPIIEIMGVAEERGLDFFVVTDHDNHVNGNITTWDDPAYHSDTLIMLYGVEYTTAYGHANLFSSQPWNHGPIYNLRGSGDGEAIAQAVHSQGLHFSANHPTNDDPWEMGFDIGLDSIEVWNALFTFPTENRMSMDLWDSLTAQGLRITARGGSDCHHQTGVEAMGLNVGNPTNWVFADDRSADAIIDALDAGHVTIGYAGSSERVILRADGDKDGVFETLMGDNLAISGLPIDFQVKIDGFRAGQDYEVFVFKNGVQILNWDQQQSTVTFTDTPDEAARTSYRVEVHGSTPDAPAIAVLLGYYGDMIGITNPIYFGF